MLVSKEWLEQYVALPSDLESVTDALTMSGLNHEDSTPVGDDVQIDLEVTSNRSDCLGHLGVAREISALTGSPLTLPEPALEATGQPIDAVFSVINEAPELCYRFTARLVRGVRVGPSPDWLVRRLATIGVESVNNIVDVSNYVMFECGQPLHAFDFDQLQDGRIVVREPNQGEELTAINHQTYRLEPGMCVIADGKRAVGLGGVMGGAETEVSDATTNVLVEAAWFSPRAIRTTARHLNLHSPASFRFERTIDPRQLDWASRRCCQLIMEVAGGAVAPGRIDVGGNGDDVPVLRLRPARVNDVLGIPVSEERIEAILTSLGFQCTREADAFEVVVPSWRRDVTREIDLVEEVGRIHGFDNVPDNIVVPMAASVRSHRERVVDRIRTAMTGLGLDEAITASLVPAPWSDAFSPWTDAPPLQSSQPMLGVLEKASQNLGAVNLLRRSLVPSLLEVFRINEYKQNDEINLFEFARVYLPNKSGLPDEPVKLAIVSEEPYARIKGMVESLLDYIAPEQVLDAVPVDLSLLDMTRSAALSVDGVALGWVGDVSEAGRERFGIRRPVSVAEIDAGVLVDLAVPIALHREVSPFPPVTRDFNFIVAESVPWSELARTVRGAAGDLLESVCYKETFRDADKDGHDRKRVLLTVVLRSLEGTLTREQAEARSEAIIAACRDAHDAALVA